MTAVRGIVSCASTKGIGTISLPNRFSLIIYSYLFATYSKYNFTLRDGTTPEAYMDLKYVEFAYKEPMDRLVVYKYHDVMNNSQTQENIRKMAIRSKRQLCSDELDHSIERRICGDQ